jgi:hypothetical protein
MRTARMFIACAALGCLLPTAASAQQELSFTRQDLPQGSLPGNRYASTGDFNNDGHVDLVFGTSLTFQLPPRIVVLLGNGDGSFQTLPSLNIEVEPSAIQVGDFNGDGQLDLVTPTAFAESAGVWLGNGDGTFQPGPDLVVGGISPFGAAMPADFNGDGALDLAMSVIGGGDSNVRVFLGNGDGSFSAGQQIVEGSPGALTIGDFDGDEVLDLAAIDFEGPPFRNRLLIALGQGDGTFAPVSQRSEVGPEAQSLTVGDFDADGQQDVATADPNTDLVSVLMGNGDGTFDPAVHLPPGVVQPPSTLVQPIDIEVADFNGDGHQDIATGNRRPSDPPIDSSASVLLGRGDGAFEPAQEFLTARGTAALVVADFNEDGLPDLATANHESSNVTILMNDPVGQTAVQIDIRPEDDENRINPRSNGTLRVAVLTSANFDATEIDPATVRFGRTGTEAAPVHFALRDVNGDGNTDAVFRFRNRQTGIACGDTSASLTGRTLGGAQISGSDAIRTAGCRNR